MRNSKRTFRRNTHKTTSNRNSHWRTFNCFLKFHSCSKHRFMKTANKTEQERFIKIQFEILISDSKSIIHWNRRFHNFLSRSDNTNAASHTQLHTSHVHYRTTIHFSFHQLDNFIINERKYLDSKFKHESNLLISW